MITLEYSSNNSGGHWWLKDEDWLALEKAGWKVEWHKDSEDPFSKGDRFLGALARAATKQFETADEGVQEWSDLTGQNPWDQGCNCCGNPHTFCYTDSEGHRHYAYTRVSTSFGGWG